MRVSIVLAALPVLAFAGPLAPRQGNCNTGPVLCCNQVQNATAPSTSNLLGLLGLSLGSITGMVGLTCNPISVLGAGGNSCSQQPVCCSGNTFGGLLALGCNPLNLNL